MKLSLKEVSLLNDWFFGKVMSDLEICRIFLEKLLWVRIQKVKLVNNQQTIDSQLNAKGVRLDVYVEDDENTIYNIEMQVRNDELTRRSRYYQSSLDVSSLQKGTSYGELNTSYIIFICAFDPFGKGRHLYSFQNRCDQDTALLLDDGAYKLFLNTKGTMDDIDSDIKEFLVFLEQTTEEIARSSKSNLVKKMYDKVASIRADQESEVEFMTYMERLKEERNEGMKEGMEKGREALIEGMLKADIEIEKIMQASGLRKEEVEAIRKNMKS